MSSDPRADPTRSAVIGHSAGGHLALWLVCRRRIPKVSPLHRDQTYRLTNAISLAGVSDLRTGFKERLGNNAVARLVGGTPDQFPDRYDTGSPIELLPSGTKQVLVHGAEDDIVPVSQSENFVEKAVQLGERPTLIRLEGIGHFDLIDPETEAWSAVIGAVRQLLALR
jgi:acetyl esterase/lipase